MEDTATVMRARLKAADIDAAVTRNASIVTVRVADTHGLDVKAMLLARNLIRLKILPNGPVYLAGGLRPFKSAFAVDYPRPTVVFQVSNPQAFRTFTARNVGREIGFFLDGKLIQRMSLMGAFDRYGNGELVGAFSMKEARLMAARYAGGALPTTVHSV